MLREELQNIFPRPQLRSYADNSHRESLQQEQRCLKVARVRMDKGVRNLGAAGYEYQIIKYSSRVLCIVIIIPKYILIHIYVDDLLSPQINTSYIVHSVAAFIFQ